MPDFIFAVRDPLAATLAGVDLPGLSGRSGRTPEMFTSGQVPQARLDDIVRRVLFALFDSGVFDDPAGRRRPTSRRPRTATSRRASRRTARSCSRTTAARCRWPARASARSIAVIGPSGADATFISGGSSGVAPAGAGPAEVTPLAGIRARAADAGVRVDAAQGSLGDAPLPALVPSAVLTPASGTGPGLLGEYWSNGDSDGAPVLTRVDPTVDLAGARPRASGRCGRRAGPAR